MHLVSDCIDLDHDLLVLATHFLALRCERSALLPRGANFGRHTLKEMDEIDNFSIFSLLGDCYVFNFTPASVGNLLIPSHLRLILALLMRAENIVTISTL